MQRRLVNLRRYDLNVYDTNGLMTTLPPSGEVVGVNEVTQMSVADFDNVGHLPVASIESRLDRVPEPVDGVAYVVPMRVLIAMHERGFDTADIYSPNMLVKDASGRIIGCRRLMQIPAVERRE